MVSEKRAYALNFQTADSRWESDQAVRGQIEGSFTVTPPKDAGGKGDKDD